MDKQIHFWAALNFPFLFSLHLWWKVSVTRGSTLLITLDPRFHQGRSLRPFTWGQTCLAPASAREGLSVWRALTSQAYPWPATHFSNLLAWGLMLLRSAPQKALVSAGGFSRAQLGHSFAVYLIATFSVFQIPQIFSHTESKLSYFPSTVIKLFFLSI